MAIVWGANGHSVVAYGSLSNTEEMNRLQTTGLRSYRIDVYNDTSDTGAKNVLRGLIDLGVPRGISILPCLIVHIEQYANDAAVYTASFNMAVYWVLAFPDVKTWEVGNESEIWNNTLKAGASGAAFTDYNDVPYATNLQFYLGCIAGIRSVMPDARVVVGTSGWHHYGFLQRLWSDGVRWDVSCFHWYSDMGDATNFSGGTNHFQVLKTSFNKPIYVTEVNARPLSMASRQAESTWLINTMTQWNSIAATYDIQAVYIYELLDEPEKSADPPEAIFGLYTETGVIKTMGTDVKTYLAGNPSADPFVLDNPPVTTISASTSPLVTFRSTIQTGVTGAIRDTHMQALVDALDQTTTAATATKTANYTAAAADNGLKIIFDASTAVTLTLPSTLPANWECAIVQLGTGQVTIQTSGGTAALRSRSSHTKTAGRYAQAYATVVSNSGGSAAQVVLTGDTAV